MIGILAVLEMYKVDMILGMNIMSAWNAMVHGNANKVVMVMLFLEERPRGIENPKLIDKEFIFPIVSLWDELILLIENKNKYL